MRMPAASILHGLVFALLILVGCSTTDKLNTADSLESRKQLVASYMSSLGSEQAKRVESNYRLIRDEFENLRPNASNSELDEVSIDPGLALNRNEVIEVVMGEGEIIAVKYKIQGAHTGNLYGIEATGKTFEIPAAAIFRVRNQEIVEGWFLADEAGLLRQIGKPMPERADGKIFIPTTVGLGSEAQPGDDVLAALLAEPQDTRDYRNKLKVAARKSNNPPLGIIPPSGRPYGRILRYGFAHFNDIGTRRGELPTNFGRAFPDRVDKVQHLIQDGDWGMINFGVTGTNTVGMYSLQLSNAPVDAWEVAFMQFDGEEWTTAWFFGDDVGLLLQLRGPQSLLFPENLDYASLENPDY